MTERAVLPVQRNRTLNTRAGLGASMSFFLRRAAGLRSIRSETRTGRARRRNNPAAGTASRIAGWRGRRDTRSNGCAAPTRPVPPGSGSPGETTWCCAAPRAVCAMSPAGSPSGSCLTRRRNTSSRVGWARAASARMAAEESISPYVEICRHKSRPRIGSMAVRSGGRVRAKSPPGTLDLPNCSGVAPVQGAFASPIARPLAQTCPAIPAIRRSHRFASWRRPRLPCSRTCGARVRPMLRPDRQG